MIRFFQVSFPLLTLVSFLLVPSLFRRCRRGLKKRINVSLLEAGTKQRRCRWEGRVARNACIFDWDAPGVLHSALHGCYAERKRTRDDPMGRILSSDALSYVCQLQGSEKLEFELNQR